MHQSRRRARGHFWTGALMALAGVTLGACAAQAAPGCDPVAPNEDTGKGADTVRSKAVPGLALTCYPGVLYAQEGAWTFLLHGSDALDVAGAHLAIAGRHVPAERLTYSTPKSLLVDFVYSEAPMSGTAELVLERIDGTEARVSIDLEPSAPIPPDERQDDLVRVQMKQGVLLYPLHGFPGDGIAKRSVEDLGGDEAFRFLLHELQITELKKIMSRYAEDDSVQWDARYLREQVYPGKTLRQYIIYLDPDRSEAAYREIFLAFDEVEGAFLNRDHRKASRGH